MENYFGLALKAQMEKDPSVLSIDLEKFEATQKKMRAERDAAAPPPEKKDLHKEYNQLRQKLFDLKQDVRCYEQRCNDAAGTIRLLEQRINDGLKQKKAAAEASNFRGERSFEHQVALLEANLTDAQEDFNKNKAWSGQAARALKNFDGHARIAELKTILDAPLPVVKSDNVPK